MVRDDIDSLDDVGMFQGRANAKLGGNLLLIFTLGLAGALWTELLHCIDTSAILAAGLDETDGTARTTTENTAPFAIFFGQVGLGSVLKGEDGAARSGRT
jgi:hypothetical protein